MHSVVSTFIKSPQRLIDRDLSWLQFNERVLQEAQDQTNPLLERLRFLGITASNLDEFFMIRFASRTSEVNSLARRKNASGDELVSALLVREELLKGTRRFLKRLSATLEDLTAQLQRQKIVLHRRNPGEGKYSALARRLFETEILPHLPAPLYFNSDSLQQVRNLQIAFIFYGKAIVTLPKNLPAILYSRDERGVLHCFFTEELTREFLGDVLGEPTLPFAFRVTRDADVRVELESSDPENIPAIVRTRVDSRERRAVVRLQAALPIQSGLLGDCLKQLALAPQEIFLVSHPLQLHGLISLVSALEGDEKVNRVLFFPSFSGCLPPPFDAVGGVLDGIERRDYLLHHPYDSFEAYVNFIQEAVEDPGVDSIQQTVYRVDTLSRVSELLCTAARAGKRVRVVIEPRARFDEIHNIQLAEEFRKAGVEVIFSVGPLKMHAKIACVTRSIGEKRQVFTHLSTGNYNAKTARQYTDLALLTANSAIGEDGLNFFDSLASGHFPSKMKVLELAPAGLHRKMISLIRAEIKAAEQGKKARIFAKVNALVDPKIIEALYSASQAGVHVDLMVRGACALVPGVQGLSERIKVFSIVDRFLEHSRVYYFESQNVLYLSSADWMPRNFFSRFEIAFPVSDPRLLSFLSQVFIPLYMQDRVKARVLTAKGVWRRRGLQGTEGIRAQEQFRELSAKLYAGTPLDEPVGF